MIFFALLKSNQNMLLFYRYLVIYVTQVKNGHGRWPLIENNYFLKEDLLIEKMSF